MLEAYRQHVAERAAQGIPPKPLSPNQVAELVALLKQPTINEADVLVDLLANRVPPGVDEAAYVKAGYLSAIAKGDEQCAVISRAQAVEMLGKMLGGYNIATLVALLEDSELAELAAAQLKHTLLMFDAFHDVDELAKAGNAQAKDVLQSWADAEWFTSRDKVLSLIHISEPTRR